MNVWASIIVLVASGCANMKCWSKRDLALEGAFVLVTAIDWKQSIPITHYCSESNPVIGLCGQRVPVSMYFPLVMVAHAAITAAIPKDWRGVWQGVGIGAELSQVQSNYSLGWRTK